MKTRYFLEAVCLTALIAMTSCQQKNVFLKEWNTPYGTAPFSQIKTTDYIPAVKAGIEAQRAEIRAIVECPDAPTFENTIAAYELSGKDLSKVLGVFTNISESDATPEIQKIDEELTPILSDFDNEIFLDAGLFARDARPYGSEHYVAGDLAGADDAV